MNNIDIGDNARSVVVRSIVTLSKICDSLNFYSKRGRIEMATDPLAAFTLSLNRDFRSDFATG